MKNKRKFSILIILLFVIQFSYELPAQDTIKISDLGLVPDSRVNAVGYVQIALAICDTISRPVVLIFQKGRYDFWPQYAIEKSYFESNTDVIPFRRCAILIENKNDLTIDCMGSDFIYHDRIQPFTVDKSRNIKIKNGY